MALVLKEKLNRDGDTKGFDVVRAENGEPGEVLKGIPTGEYHIMDGKTISKYKSSYRLVQDIEPAE